MPFSYLRCVITPANYEGKWQGRAKEPFPDGSGLQRFKPITDRSDRQQYIGDANIFQFFP
ncbi:Uncharacterised protein [Serratia quinivorans]|jgi:hypothetical protein|nr:Uncharacterised protein [Serratia quinivorans]